MPRNSDFSVSRDEIIRAAFRRIGIRTTTPDHLSIGAFSLNLAIAELDDEGRFGWTHSPTESTITLANGTRTYTVGVGASNIPDYMLKLETFSLLIGSRYVPLDIITRNEAVETWLREGTGQPIAVYLECKADPTDNVLHVFQTPNSAYTGKFTYRRMVYDFDGANDKLDFPVKWGRAVILATAEILAGDYGAPDLADIVAQKTQAVDKAMRSADEKPRRSRPVKITNF
jgi:hypothetical protein